MKKIFNYYLLIGIGGALLTLLFSWEWNTPIAVWAGLLLLVRFYRNEVNIWKIALISGLLILAKFYIIHGSWHMGLTLEITIAIFTLMPLFIPLFVDRYFNTKLKPGLKTLIFPLVFTTLDYLLGLSLIGTTFSLAVTQYGFEELRQITGITGIWGISFMLAWFASSFNHFIEEGLDFKKTKTTFNAFIFVLVVLLAYGGAKLTFLKADKVETVKIAGITATHQIDFWQITDSGTLPQDKEIYQPEMDSVHEDLFEKSQRAADLGAKIIFWSEGNAPMYEDDYDTFVEQASNFASTNNVYLLAGALVYKYNSYENLNIVISFDPTGQVIDVYEKTISWYPSTSDGILPVIETEYGTLSTVICFDLDFPALIKQAANKNIDILIVPAFDTEKISPFHTEVGLFRSTDYGLNIVRQVNKGTSMAVDFNGSILAYQHYFNTKDHIMMTDVPIAGTKTIYGIIGDAFVYVNILALLVIITFSIKEAVVLKKYNKKNKF